MSIFLLYFYYDVKMRKLERREFKEVVGSSLGRNGQNPRSLNLGPIFFTEALYLGVEGGQPFQMLLTHTKIKKRKK